MRRSADDLVGQPVQRLRVVEDLPRVGLVDLGHVGVQPERPVVASSG